METFEWIIALLLGAALLSALARRMGIPYPTLLALGGVCLAFIPGSPTWTLDPQLALTLFVAPVLLDTAYDSSPRDLRRNWRSVAGLAIIAVGATTAAVAIVAHWLVPEMPWPIAIALGAIVSPPDAAAAAAVVRHIGLPHRILTILEGESLLNDASALLLYRLAVLAAVSGGLSPMVVVPAFLLSVVGSVVAGVVLAFLFERVHELIRDVPTALIVQFASTFAVWIAADAVGLSGILTIVAYAITIARISRLHMPARMRVPVNAVWETAVFVLNAFAFVLIGMQLRPIWQRLEPPVREEFIIVALAVLLTAVIVRFAWVMGFVALSRRPRPSRGRAGPPGPKPTFRGALAMAWAGMRGIVTLATAFALPARMPDGSPFPFRDLVLLTAFCVVFGTLVVQGLTLRPLIRMLKLDGNADPVADEVKWARAEALRAALATIDGDQSEEAKLLREEYEKAIEASTADGDGALDRMPGNPIRRRAVQAARTKANDMRLQGTIGDEAYRVLESEFDWADLSAGAATDRAARA